MKNDIEGRVPPSYPMDKTYFVPVMSNKKATESAALDTACIAIYSKIVSILVPSVDDAHLCDVMQTIHLLVNGVIPPSFNLFYGKMNGYLQSNFHPSAYVLLTKESRAEQIRKDVETIARVSRPWDVLTELFGVKVDAKTRSMIRALLTDILVDYTVRLYYAGYGWCDVR